MDISLEFWLALSFSVFLSVSPHGYMYCTLNVLCVQTAAPGKLVRDGPLSTLSSLYNCSRFATVLFVITVSFRVWLSRGDLKGLGVSWDGFGV